MAPGMNLSTSDTASLATGYHCIIRSAYPQNNMVARLTIGREDSQDYTEDSSNVWLTLGRLATPGRCGARSGRNSGRCDTSRWRIHDWRAREHDAGRILGVVERRGERTSICTVGAAYGGSGCSDTAIGRWNVSAYVRRGCSSIAAVN